MNLFVDSNVFLQFYHYSKGDLEELRKLHELIAKGEITLFITEQIRAEVARNRDNVVFNAISDFVKTKQEQAFPWIAKTYPEYTEMKKLIRELEIKKNDLEKKMRQDIESVSLEADKLISLLFGVAAILPVGEYRQKARDRYDFGNPPGKDWSYGDALNWETLLSLAPEGEMFLVTDDSDYKSRLDDSKLNPFLYDEWKEKHKAPIFFYGTLSQYFSEHSKHINLKNEEELNELVLDLCRSGNFAWTHNKVSQLSKYTHFSDPQIYQMVEASVNNNQIRWISNDSDVNAFFLGLVKGKENLFPPELFEEFKNCFYEQESETEPVPC